MALSRRHLAHGAAYFVFCLPQPANADGKAAILLTGNITLVRQPNLTLENPIEIGLVADGKVVATTTSQASSYSMIVPSENATSQISFRVFDDSLALQRDEVLNLAGMNLKHQPNRRISRDLKLVLKADRFTKEFVVFEKGLLEDLSRRDLSGSAKHLARIEEEFVPKDGEQSFRHRIHQKLAETTHMAVRKNITVPSTWARRLLGVDEQSWFRELGRAQQIGVYVTSARALAASYKHIEDSDMQETWADLATRYFDRAIELDSQHAQAEGREISTQQYLELMDIAFVARKFEVCMETGRALLDRLHSEVRDIHSSKRKRAIVALVTYGRCLDALTGSHRYTEQRYLRMLNRNVSWRSYWSWYATTLDKYAPLFAGGVTEESQFLEAKREIAAQVKDFATQSD